MTAKAHYRPSWFHLAPFIDYYRRGEFENAFDEALKFNFPELYWDPLMRAAALGRLGKQGESMTAVRRLLALAPVFATQGRWLISRYVKLDKLVEKILDALRTVWYYISTNIIDEDIQVSQLMILGSVGWTFK